MVRHCLEFGKVRHPAIVFGELLHPRSAPGLGAFCMCCMMLAPWPLGAISHTLGVVWLALAAGATLALTTVFLVQSYRHHLPLEPSNFPATVSIGLLPLMAAKLEVPPAIGDSALALGIVLATAITPAVVCRLCASRTHVADPSVWPLAAPWALLSAAWHSTDGGVRTPPELGTALALISLTLLIATIGFAAARSRAIRGSFFSPSWAMFTFPTCTNAISLMRFADRLHSSPLVYVSRFVAAAAVAVSLTVAILTYVHLPRWMRRPPERPRQEMVSVARQEMVTLTSEV